MKLKHIIKLSISYEKTKRSKSETEYMFLKLEVLLDRNSYNSNFKLMLNSDDIECKNLVMEYFIMNELSKFDPNYIKKFSEKYINLIYKIWCIQENNFMRIIDTNVLIDVNFLPLSLKSRYKFWTKHGPPRSI